MSAFAPPLPPAPAPLWSLHAFAAALALYFCLPDGAAARDLIYAFPALFLLEALARGRAALHPGPALLGLGYLALYLPLALRNGPVAVHEAVFVLASLAVAALRFRTPARLPEALLLAGAVVLMTQFLAGGPDSLSGADLLRSAKAATETSLGLALPLVVIAAWTRKRPGLGVIGLLISLAMFKRIALLALLLTLVLDWLQFGRPRPGRAVQVLRLGLIVAVFAIGLNTPWLFELLSELAQRQLDLAISPDELSSGRYLATGLFAESLAAQNSAAALIVGHGPGFSTLFLAQSPDLAGRHFPLLHNDILRLFADYGVTGMVLAAAALWHMARRARLHAAFGCYTAILFLTDNVLTYFYYWVVLIALLRCRDEDPDRP